MGKFFYNIALACFTVVVLGNATPWLLAMAGKGATEYTVIIIFGVAATSIFVYIANNILKR